MWDLLPLEIQDYIQELADRNLHREDLAAVCAQITEGLCHFPQQYRGWRCKTCGKRRLR